MLCFSCIPLETVHQGYTQSLYWSVEISSLFVIILFSVTSQPKAPSHTFTGRIPAYKWAEIILSSNLPGTWAVGSQCLVFWSINVCIYESLLFCWRTQQHYLLCWWKEMTWLCIIMDPHDAWMFLHFWMGEQRGTSPWSRSTDAAEEIIYLQRSERCTRCLLHVVFRQVWKSSAEKWELFG